MLDDRKAEILRILVAEHIRTGAPVSSRAILAAGGLAVSAATVRNELAFLEAEGYVAQPHTSAGRVPTAVAYRHYVDRLHPSAHQPFPRISEFFGSVQIELGRLLKATSALLSEITHYPALVTSSGLGVELIRAIHLVQTASDVVLLVVITRSGRVSQTILNLECCPDAGELEETERLVRNCLTDMPVGTPMEENPGFEPANPTVAQVGAAVGAALTKIASQEGELYVGPTSYLTEVWGDISKLRGVLEVLEREASLLAVLSHMPDGTAVRIGGELGMDAPADISLVSTSYGTEEGDLCGRVGVIGPMRMDYGRTISAVEEVGGGLEESLSHS